MSDSHGKVIWSELNTRTPVEATHFFKAVLGLSSVENPLPNGGLYRTLMKGEEMVAGVLDISGPEFEGVSDAWLTYMGCDDVNVACDAVKAEGGTVMREPFDIPFVGRVAIISDPSGAVVALMTPSNPG